MSLTRSMRQMQVGLAIVRRPRRVPAMPYYLAVGTTTACPLSCIMCSRESVIERADHLDLETYKRLVDAVRPPRISVGDLGESLFDPDLDQKIRYAKERDAMIDVVTSYAISKFPPAVLVETGLDVLHVSIDGATAETYEAIRGKPYLEAALEHTRDLIQTRQSLNRRTPSVHLRFTMQKRNHKEIVDYVRLAAETGVDAIVYGILWLDLDLKNRDLLVGDLAADDVFASLQEARHLANSLGIQTNVRALTRSVLRHNWDIYDGSTSQPRDLKRCKLPWYSAYVAADGNVYGCCYQRVRDDKVLGNIHDSDFDSIWNGEAYQEFRRRMRVGHSPFRTCYSCYPRSVWDRFR